MKRYQLVEKRKEWPDGPEHWADMDERDDGPYCLYSEAQSVIGDLRKRLEEANGKLRSAQLEPRGHPWERRGGYDERKFN